MDRQGLRDLNRREAVIREGVETHIITKLQTEPRWSYESVKVVNKFNNAVEEYPEVEKCLCTWIKQARNNNIPISGPMIKEKAQEFATLLHDYSPDDVFNADEACVFYKCLPDKIFTFKGQSCHGGKLSKDWVTELEGSCSDVLKSIEENKSPEINILQAMRFARKACFSLSKTTISNCFQKAGFKVTNVSDPESLQEELEICAAFPERDRIFTTCRNDLNEQQVNFQDFVSMDDNVLISEKLNDDDIVAMYSSLDTEEEEEDCEETPVKI
ncbi:tigger transposable element-derived protein 6-like [Pararge aegeria]|uniref:tigger transposable element-derived protein 6-like n=1 Tax=Pararge aegeria TaxID=116150 RepID=UPI0019D1A9C2|nr:tigger transposable element-derived protein 6-like [Pararge aegeria]